MKDSSPWGIVTLLFVIIFMLAAVLNTFDKYDKQLGIAKSFESDKEFWHHKYLKKQKELQDFESYVSNSLVPKGYKLQQINSSYNSDTLYEMFIEALRNENKMQITSSDKGSCLPG